MSNANLKRLGLQNAQHRVEILARNTDAFLLEPELLSTVLEELAVVLEEISQQFEELLTNRQALEAQRQHFQELFDFAPDGYLVTNVQGIIQEANQAAGKLFGIRQDLLVGKPLVLFVSKLDRRAFLTYITALQTSAQPRNWDLHLKPRQGKVFPVVMTTSATRSSEGALTGWRWLLRDITELRHATVLTRESAGEAKLDNLRSNFIQMISHELRTPMTIILTALELLKLRTTASPAQQQLYFDRIQQATWRINALLNDVLLYNDAAATSRPLMPTQLDLEALCQAVVRAQQTQGNNHTITVSSNGACAAVSVDEERVRQMLDRLLANAVTYSPVGTTVSLNLQCGGDRTCISVHNEGTSIPPEEQAHLFEPFYRSAATEHIPGIGLGLAIVKQAVDAHGGELTVESSTDGVTFTIALPSEELGVRGEG